MTQPSPSPSHWVGRLVEATWQRPEILLLGGTVAASFVISGAAIAVLFSPNLGQQLAYVPLIDEDILEANRQTSLGEQLLGQVARVLEIDIVETQGPTIGARNRPKRAMTIVAQADEPTVMPEADLSVGLKTMLVATGVGLTASGLIRLIPSLPIGPKRRKPLRQRLSLSLGGQSLVPESGSLSQTLMPGAMAALSGPSHDSKPLHQQLHNQAQLQTQAPGKRRRSRVRRKLRSPRPLQRLQGMIQPSAIPSSPSKLSQGLSKASGTSIPASLTSQSSNNRENTSLQRSHPNQPNSFVILQSQTASTHKPRQTSPRQTTSTSILFNQSSRNATGNNLQGALDLDALDIRRQYPLAALG